jgi:thymidylate synthase (FAD)
MENTQVKLKWATPDADAEIAYIARVSNPANQANESIAGLLQYCMSNGHVSPFEMANVCLEINTTRDIGRQILRHRSFSFQEFSQRYASTEALPLAPLRECRLQDTKNRQNSIEVGRFEHEGLQRWWTEAQMQINGAALQAYSQALKAGIAKEQARALLPEGLTASRMYMNGTMRSWIHYLGARLDPSTQKEHRELAGQALAIIRVIAPVTMNAFFPVVAQ